MIYFWSPPSSFVIKHQAILFIIYTIAAEPYPIQHSYIIALHVPKALPIARAAAHYLNLSNVSVFPAINASQALLFTEPQLSLYTQYLLHYHLGRHDHMQLSTAPMLGCLLSHMHIWSSIKPNETVAIFEEDAYFDEVSHVRFRGLMLNMKGVEWDILMLEAGSVIASGRQVEMRRGIFMVGGLRWLSCRWKYVGEYAATCAQQPCSWFGTRGYLLTYR